MRFYTNVHQRFDEILVRGYENGKHFTARETFHPTFYVPSKKKSKYKTLEGESVEPIKPGKISECKQFIDKYSEVDNFDVTEMTDISVSISPKNIQKKKSNLILVKLN